jgi:hypothetical protein
MPQRAWSAKREHIKEGLEEQGRSEEGAARTRDQLYAEAKRKSIRGRSRMNKAQLQRAVDR